MSQQWHPSLTSTSFLLLALSFPLALAPALAAVVPEGFVDEGVASGFDRPMALRFLPDGRMLIAERAPADVLVLSADGSRILAIALTIPNVPDEGERGLLSIAVDPAWPSRPYLYAFFARNEGTNELVLARYTATGDIDGSGDGVIEFASPVELLTGLPDGSDIHNGGDLRWDDVGALYLSIGDDDDNCAAQDPTSPLGKVLRLDRRGRPGFPQRSRRPGQSLRRVLRSGRAPGLGLGSTQSLPHTRRSPDGESLRRRRGRDRTRGDQPRSRRGREPGVALL